MKKYVILFLLFMFPFIVRAETCDTSSVEIKKVEVIGTSGNASENTSAKVNNKTIGLDLSMNHVNDSITYKIIVKNNSKEDYEINNNLNNDSKYIEYSFVDNTSSVIKAKSEKEVYIKAEYKSEVPSTLLNNGVFKDSKEIQLSLSTLSNPKTGFIIPTVLFITLIVSLMCYMILKKEFSFKALNVLFILLFAPILINASCNININIKSDVEIKKMAMFDTGLNVNGKMKSFEDVNSIYSIKRSDTLPSNIKTLVDNQLLESKNITVSDEEVNELFESYDYLIPVDNFEIKIIDGLEKYCSTYQGQEYCIFGYDGNYDDYNRYYKVLLKGEEEYKYVFYDREDGKTLFYNSNEFKNKLKEDIYDKKKAQIEKNVFSSKNSDYIIYGWYDNNTIYYYCESKDVYLNPDSSYMIYGFFGLRNIPGIQSVNTSKAKFMNSFFEYAPRYNSTDFTADLSNWDTSNVITMKRMFSNSGYFESSFDVTWDVGDLSKWDTSKVVDMSEMFKVAGGSAKTWNVGDLSKWNTSKVVDMSGMFNAAGKNATTWSIGDLSNWNTSKVTDMSDLFYHSGYNSNKWNIGDLSNWNTSNVTNMSNMFGYTGKNITNWSVGDLSKWNVSKVEDMDGMFSNIGENATTCNIGNITSWDTSSLMGTAEMFSHACKNATSWDIGDLSSWDTSRVEDMRWMFNGAAQKMTNINLDLHNWDTSKVTEMNYIFSEFGKDATTININLSNWIIMQKNTLYTLFENFGTNANTVNLNMSSWNYKELEGEIDIFRRTADQSKNITLNLSNLKAPKANSTDNMLNYFGSNAESLTINVSNWDIPNVTSMKYMYYRAGLNSTVFNIIGLNTWNTSNVINMSGIFYDAGVNATSWNIGDLSNWDVSNVIDMSVMFTGSGENATTWSVGDLSNWNMSKVTDISNMFTGAGENATTWKSIGTLNIYADNIGYAFRYVSKAKMIINLYKKPSIAEYALDHTALVEGSSVVVNYTSEVTSIDSIISTRSSNSNVVKGSLIE